MDDVVKIQKIAKRFGCILLHPLSNIESTKYLNYEPKFNVVYSRNYFHWIYLFIDTNIAVYSGSKGMEHIPQEIFCKIR